VCVQLLSGGYDNEKANNKKMEKKLVLSVYNILYCGELYSGLSCAFVEN